MKKELYMRDTTLIKDIAKVEVLILLINSFLPSGKLIKNGKFAKAANYFKDGLQQSEKVRAYQKIKKTYGY